MEKRIEVLAKFLEVEVDTLSKSVYAENTFTDGTCEFLVLTDEEADDATRNAILESLWAFNVEFIVEHLNVDPSPYEVDRLVEAVKQVQNTLCEDANVLVKNLVYSNLDDFIMDAIDADGRGHFLSSYDGEEKELDGYFIYCV